MPKEKLLLIIKGDTNDADYIHEITENFPEEELPRLEKIAKVVLKLKDDWQDRDEDDFNRGGLTEDDISWFDCFVPHNGDQDTHSIDSVMVFKTSGTVLNVDRYS